MEEGSVGRGGLRGGKVGEVSGVVECRFEDESLPGAIIKSDGRN